MSEWSTAEGQTPLDDVSGLIPRHVRTRRQLNAFEAENIREAVSRYLAGRPTRRQARFDLAWSLKLHRQMFGRVWRWAGTIRRVETNMGAPPHRIAVDLKALMDDLAYWRGEGAMPLIEQAARLHHRGVAIHPFLNGNGRWARMLANIWLKQNGATPTVWPEATIGAASVIREEYLAAIRAADAGRYDELIALHERYTLRA
jgi:Fic-DOC domain mobile mystery protein B